jgi:hypothetical protein
LGHPRQRIWRFEQCFPTVWTNCDIFGNVSEAKTTYIEDHLARRPSTREEL